MKKILLPLLPVLAGCTDSDCPLDNIVEMGCGIYASETGQPLQLTDTLTIRVAGRDTILLNRAQGISSFYLPLRHSGTVDTLLLRLSNAKGQVATDTLFVTHTSVPHFESIDCPAAVFHEISTARHTSHALSLMPLTIDSVAVSQTSVNYDDKENLKIYLRSTSH